MNKARLFTLIILGSLLVALGTYVALVQGHVLQLVEKHAIIISVTISVIFGGGIPIIAPSFRQDPEKFVGRFLVLTTVQLLLAMSILLAFIVSKQSDAKMMCFHFISLFVLILIIQSLGLIKFANSTDK
jgi:Mg/Co/Ni transporter MgtE